jgi:hypothetical protein
VQRALVRPREVFDPNVVKPPLAAQRGAIAEEAGDGRGVQRGRHDDDAEVRPRSLLQAAQDREGDVGREVPLVKLVQDDAGDARELRVREEPAREHAFGQKAQPRARARHVLEAHLIADRLAGAFAPLFGDAARGHARRDAARLERPHLAAAANVRVEQRRGHARRLARARRGLYDKARPRRRDSMTSGMSASIGSDCINEAGGRRRRL